MNCEEARGRLLEASPAALAGHGESVVARHVRSCAACAALATRILDGTEQLAADFESVQPRMSADDAVRAALEGRAALESEHGAGGRPSAGPGPTARRGAGSGASGAGDGRSWRRWASLPLAAAAAIAALMLTAGPQARPGETGPFAPWAESVAAAPGQSPAGLSVDVPERGRVAVFETSDPSVTVVWFY